MQRLQKGIALIAIALFATATAMAAEYTIKMGHLANTDHTWHKASLKFGEIVAEKSGGRIEVIVYPNNEIGSEMEVIDQIHGGLAHMVISSDSMSNWAPTIALLSVPYMIRDLEHMDKILASETGRFIAQEVIDKVGLRPLAAFARAPRNVTSNRPVKSVADAAGLKMRLPSVPLHVACWEAVSVKPTPMAFSEVFTSLQQGVIDAQENPPDLIRSASFFEVQKYMNLTEHVRTWIYFLIGEDFYQELPEDLQKIVLEAGAEVQKYERDLHVKSVQDDLEFLKSKGMEFVEADKPAFAKAMQPAIEKFLGDLDKEKGTELIRLYKDILAM